MLKQPLMHSSRATRRLLFHKVRPIFVFDGATPALKRSTAIARRRRREVHTATMRKTAEKLLINQLKRQALNLAAQHKAAGGAGKQAAGQKRKRGGGKNNKQEEQQEEQQEEEQEEEEQQQQLGSSMDELLAAQLAAGDMTTSDADQDSDVEIVAAPAAQQQAQQQDSQQAGSSAQHATAGGGSRRPAGGGGMLDELVAAQLAAEMDGTLEARLMEAAAGGQRSAKGIVIREPGSQPPPAAGAAGTGDVQPSRLEQQEQQLQHVQRSRTKAGSGKRVTWGPTTTAGAAAAAAAAAGSGAAEEIDEHAQLLALTGGSELSEAEMREMEAVLGGECAWPLALSGP
jgi:hypothetical protein